MIRVAAAGLQALHEVAHLGVRRPLHPVRPGAPMITADSEVPASGEYDSPARLISGNAPVYPISRRMKGTGGQATIAFTILEDGTTADFVVISTDYAYYASHTVLAIKEWRYTPAVKGGRPVSTRVVQTFQFVMS